MPSESAYIAKDLQSRSLWLTAGRDKCLPRESMQDAQETSRCDTAVNCVNLSWAEAQR